MEVNDCNYVWTNLGNGEVYEGTLIESPAEGEECTLRTKAKGKVFDPPRKRCIKSVTFKTGDNEWKGFKEGYVLSAFYYSSGDVATFSTIWNKPFPWQVIVTTQKQRIELKPLEICKSFSLNKMNKRTYKIDIKDKIFKPGIYNQTLELIKSIKKRKNSLMKINHGYKLMKYLDKIYK